MPVPILDIGQLERIHVGNRVNDDVVDERHRGRAIHPDHVTTVTVDPHAIFRDISSGDTIIAAAYDTDTLDALLTPADTDGSVDIETRDDWQSTLGYPRGTQVSQS